MLLTTALRSGTNMLRRALLGCCLVVIAIGMTTVYIAPAWFERGLVTIDNVRAPIWSPANNLILPWRLIFDSGFFSVGIAPTLGVIVAATSLAISRVRRNAALLIGWWTPAILIITLLLKSGWTEWFWTQLPLGSFIQFPWRLLGFVGLFSSVGIGITWALMVPAELGAYGWLCAFALSLALAFVEQPYRTFTYGTLDVPDALTTPTGVLKQATDPATGIPYTTVIANEYLPQTAILFDKMQRRLLPGLGPSRIEDKVTAAGSAQVQFSQPCPSNT